MRIASTLAAVVMAACGIVAAPAGLASAETPQAVIARYENEGYNVHVDRVGSAPLEDCIVTGVRNPQTITQTIPVERGKRRYLVEVIISRSISISLDCTG